jgi:hypothetical protein
MEKIKLFGLISFLMVCLALISAPCLGEDQGIHGDLSFKYEMANDFSGQSWRIDVYYNIFPWLALGTTETTYTAGYNTYFDVIPAFVPSNQLYEFYLKINFDDYTSLKICQWCNHLVYSGSGIADQEIPNGVYIEGRYKF